MIGLARAAAQQKDNLCGPFWAARVLSEAGCSGIDEDDVATRAGTTLPPEADAPSVPPGATSRTDYRLPLARVSAAESGTSASSLVRAVESLSGGKLQAFPIRGQWTARRVEQLVERAPSFARLIANVRTGRLWGSRPPIDSLLEELAGLPVEGPPADWDVGHFVELAMLVRGRQGTLVIVHDSYPSLGWDGHHLQPPRAVAAALLRGDGREGGVLAIATRDRADAIAGLASELGLEIGTWNNGSRSAGHGDR